jgi:hypothetical protein
VRRRHLAEHGVDVRGLDALLTAAQESTDGTKIGAFVVPTVDANLIGFVESGALASLPDPEGLQQPDHPSAVGVRLSRRSRAV